MNRLPVEWLAAPGEEDEIPDDGLELAFTLREPWVAVDADQLILPITVEDKTTITVEEPYDALLKQYGGEGLLNDMLLADADLEAGSSWVLIRLEQLLTIEPRD